MDVLGQLFYCLWRNLLGLFRCNVRCTSSQKTCKAGERTRACGQPGRSGC